MTTKRSGKNNGTTFTSEEAKTIEELQRELEATRKALEEAKLKSAPRIRKLTPEQEEVRKAREAWEAVEPAKAGSLEARVQGLTRIQQIDAFPKLVRKLPWREVAPLFVQLFDMVVEHNNVKSKADREDLFEEVTCRKAKDNMAEQVKAEEEAFAGK